jgi:hypothetical protein
MAVSKNIMGRVVYGDLRVELVAEGASWNPDVADDMIKRLNGMWRASLESMIETGTWEHDVPVEED